LQPAVLAFVEAVASEPSTKGVYKHGDASYYFTKSKGTTFVAVSPNSVDKAVVMSFLDEVIKENESGGDKDKEKHMYELRFLLYKYKDPSKMDKITKLRSEVEAVKDIMNDNIRKMMETKQQTERLDVIAATFEYNAVDFKDRGGRVRQVVVWRQWRFRVIIAVVVAVLLIVLIGVFVGCGPNMKYC